MATIITKDDLKRYLLATLGDPVITVEISDEQLNNCVDDAIDDFTRYNVGEGGYQDFMSLSLSAYVDTYNLSGQNIDSTIDFTTSLTDGINTLFAPTHMVMASDIAAGRYITNYGLVDWNIAMMYLQEIKNSFGTMFTVTYYPGQQILKVYPTPTQNMTGLLAVYKKEQAIFLFNNVLVRKLALAKARKQWGTNTKKYSITLPGGGTINGQEIYNEGVETEKDILAQIKKESAPVDFFVG
jgi:hypothetical protein